MSDQGQDPLCKNPHRVIKSNTSLSFHGMFLYPKRPVGSPDPCRQGLGRERRGAATVGGPGGWRGGAWGPQLQAPSRHLPGA